MNMTPLADPGFHPSASKAWHYTTYSAGVPSIQASYNVSSLSDVGVGALGVNLTVVFSSGLFPVLCGSQNSSSNQTGDPVISRAAVINTHTSVGGTVAASAEDISQADALARAHKDVPAGATNIHEIEDADIPEDRTYRNAWTTDGKTISHDMAKARDIHRATLRTLRAPLLNALDVSYMRADEAGDVKTKQAIATRKQKLRDVTNDPRIAAATTIEALKSVDLRQTEKYSY
jgi:hypothetical protein